MSLTVPLTVTAKNEERALGACLDLLLAAAAFAEARLAIRIDPLVVLDDTRDASAAIAASRGVAIATSRGGKVEAQRTGVQATAPGSPFHMFADADIVVERDTLAAICDAMLADDRIQVAVPAKRPLAPRRASPLAAALHVYNTRRGWASSQAWFSGKLFAIRSWDIPGASELADRARGLPASRFYEHAAPLTVDDIYLSRRIVRDHGSGALRETAGCVWYRAPESWLGMYRYYRRMRRELERIEALFPELGPPAARAPDRLAAAPPADRRAWRVFHLALAACRVAYRVDRIACELGLPAGAAWPAIAETKAL